MMKSTTFNRSCVSASGVTEMSTWFEASTGTFVSWLTGTGSSLTSSRLAYSFASIHAGPLQVSPDPLVFSTSHGALASTPTRKTPAFRIASMRGLVPGGGTPGACASAATAKNVLTSAPANPFVVLVMAMLSSCLPRRLAPLGRLKARLPSLGAWLDRPRRLQRHPAGGPGDGPARGGLDHRPPPHPLSPRLPARGERRGSNWGSERLPLLTEGEGRGGGDRGARRWRGGRRRAGRWR